MSLRDRVKRAAQTARAELADAVRQAGEQNEIKEAREAFARRKLPPDQRAAAKAKSDAEKAEREARAQEQARLKAAEFRQRSEEAQRAAAEVQKREKATLRCTGWFMGATEPPDGALIPNICKVVLHPDGIKIAQSIGRKSNWTLDISWQEIQNIEVEDATTRTQRSQTRMRQGKMGGVFKWNQWIPVAETETITSVASEMLVESDRGAFYFQLVDVGGKRLKGWLMGTERLWKRSDSRPI